MGIDVAEDPFMTFEEAGEILGGKDRPISRQSLNKLLDEGKLKDNGFPHKARRISRRSLNAYIAQLEEGESACPEPESPPSPRTRRSAPVTSTMRPVGQDTRSLKSPMDVVTQLLSVP